MVENEIGQRVAVLADQGLDADRSASAIESRDVLSAAFRLAQYLDSVQPITPLSGGGLFPSLSLHLVLSALPIDSSPEEMRAALSETLKEAVSASVNEAIHQ